MYAADKNQGMLQMWNLAWNMGVLRPLLFPDHANCGAYWDVILVEIKEDDCLKAGKYV